ncbi:MAG: hypothetical protein AAGC95_01825 [Pseudomonadota bacterium]
MDIFSTRELALAIWLCAIIAVCIYFKTTRRLAISVVKHALHKRLVWVYCITVFYIVLIVLLLWQLGIWNITHLKSTIIWAVTVGFISLFRLPDRAEDFGFFRQVVIDNLKLIVILEFIISMKPFAFWQELILIPTATFLTLIAEFSKNKPEYRIAYKLFSGTMSILGVIVIIFAFKGVLGDLTGFFSLQTLSDFTLPPILTFLFLPYLYALALYNIYETAFVVLKMPIQDKKVRDYAYFASIVAFGNNVKLLHRWRRDVMIVKPKSVEAVKQTVRDVLHRRKRELKPVAVPLEQGWSPYIAKEYLVEAGLISGEYHRSLPELPDWSSSSNHIDLGDGSLPNHISFYVDGDENVAKQLKLVLNVNEIDAADDATQIFVDLAEQLCEAALEHELPSELRVAIFARYNEAVTLNGKAVSVRHEDFENNELGYTAYFTTGHYVPSYMKP